MLKGNKKKVIKMNNNERDIVLVQKYAQNHMISTYKTTMQE